jgi:hypothetical protein
MALETLKGVEELGGFKVVVMDDLREKHPRKFNESGGMDYKWFEKEIRPHNFVYVRQDKNSIAFTIQNGPVKEKGVNGCQVDTLIHAAKRILEELNRRPTREEQAAGQKDYSTRETSLAITKLQEAIFWLDERTRDRRERDVEGRSMV